MSQNGQQKHLLVHALQKSAWRPPLSINVYTQIRAAFNMETVETKRKNKLQGKKK